MWFLWPFFLLITLDVRAEAPPPWPTPGAVLMSTTTTATTSVEGPTSMGTVPTVALTTTKPLLSTTPAASTAQVAKPSPPITIHHDFFAQPVANGKIIDGGVTTYTMFDGESSDVCDAVTEFQRYPIAFKGTEMINSVTVVVKKVNEALPLLEVVDGIEKLHVDTSPEEPMFVMHDKVQTSRRLEVVSGLPTFTVVDFGGEKAPAHLMGFVTTPLQKVTYEWSFKSAKPVSSGCSSCGSFPCPDKSSPVCDGSQVVQCVPWNGKHEIVRLTIQWSNIEDDYFAGKANRARWVDKLSEAVSRFTKVQLVSTLLDGASAGRRLSYHITETMLQCKEECNSVQEALVKLSPLDLQGAIYQEGVEFGDIDSFSSIVGLVSDEELQNQVWQSSNLTFILWVVLGSFAGLAFVASICLCISKCAKKRKHSLIVSSSSDE